MSQNKTIRILGLTYLQIGILAGLGTFLSAVVGCLALMLLYSNLSASSTAFIPAHKVNDFWDNGKGTNFAYFIVVDKSITETEAKAIIENYQSKHNGYKLMNVYIYCDALYADVEYWDAMNDSGDPGDKIFEHVMYWSRSGEWASAGGFLMTKPNVDYPTFGQACK